MTTKRRPKARALTPLQRARDWCAKAFKMRYDGREHGSFLAGEILEEAATLFDLGGYGVEGWSSENGATGVQYLNFGDPYLPTIYVRSWHNGASFHYGAGGWGPLVGG